MRFTSCKYTADYPLYAATFIQSNALKATLLVAGGGGEGKNGIPNMITSLKFNSQTSQFSKLQDIELPEEGDSPTAMDASIANGVVLVGCNSNSEKIGGKLGNEHLKQYNMDLRLQLEAGKSVDLFQSSNPDEYTKLIKLTSDGSRAAIASSIEDQTLIKVVDSETLETRFEINDKKGGEVKDAGFAPNGEKLAFITPKAFNVVSTMTGEVIMTLEEDFAKNNWNLSKMKFIDDYRVLIVATTHDSKDKRHSGVVLIKVQLSGNKKATIIQSQFLTNKFKGITAMDLHTESDLLVLATSENSVLIVKLSNFDIKSTFHEIHTFAVTSVAISPNGRYVASVSAANTIHMVQIPENFKNAISNRKESFQMWSSIILLILAIAFYKISTENKEYFKAKIAEKNIQLPDFIQNLIKGYMRMTNMNQQNPFGSDDEDLVIEKVPEYLNETTSNLVESATTSLAETIATITTTTTTTALEN